MPSSLVRTAIAAVATMALAACGGGGGGSTGPQPNTIALSAGANQVGAAGTALPESLAVIVKDQSGAVLAGITVNWTIVDGGGSVSPTSRTTNAAGIAKTLRTLGPGAGTQTARATVSGLTPVNFDAVAQIQGAVNIANSSTGALTDTVLSTKAESLSVLVTDQNATPVAGVTVTWGSTGGSVSPTSRPTNATGVSKTEFTYGGTVGNQTATATVTGLVGSPVSITFNATAGNATTIVKTAGDNLTASPGAQVTHTVQGRDSHGNAKSGVKVDWLVGTGGGSITPAQNFTGATGNAAAQRTLGSVSGNNTATATATDLPGAPQVTFSAAGVWTVQVSDNVFTPTSRTITHGDSVAFQWQGTTSVPHNVTFAAAAGKPTDIGNQTSGTFRRTFPTAGTFNFQCSNHPATMNGTITVN